MEKIRQVTKQYKTVAQLVAHEYTEYVGICTDGKRYYVHHHNSVFDYVNPTSTYSDAKYINGVLCIIV